MGRGCVLQADSVCRVLLAPMLDRLGRGIGWVANSKQRYCGTNIVEFGIEWCYGTPAKCQGWDCVSKLPAARTVLVHLLVQHWFRWVTILPKMCWGPAFTLPGVC